MPVVRFAVFTVLVPDGWEDVTDSLDIEDPPITLARADGVGALQFSIAAYSSGDARSAYNALEVAATLAQDGKSKRITGSIATDALQKRVLMYDKAGEEHYNLISALHKSVRNSDPDAAVYWLARMLEAGEDGLYIARRVVRMASEDVGLADPNALSITLAARDAYDFLGTPEGNLALAEAVVYLCAAPKSNALETAYGAVQQDVEQTAQDPVPLHLRNAPTGLMKKLGYGKGYQYAHNLEEKVADMQCLPDNLKGRRYYHPTEEGLEKRIKARLDEIRQLKKKSHHQGVETQNPSESHRDTEKKKSKGPEGDAG